MDRIDLLLEKLRAVYDCNLGREFLDWELKERVKKLLKAVEEAK